MNKGLICPRCKNFLRAGKNKYGCLCCSVSYPIIDDICCFVERDSKGSGFRVEMFEFLFEREKKHFWHTGRKEIIYQMLNWCAKGRIKNLRMLEVGCGNGIVVEYLNKKGVNVEGADISMEGLRFCKKRVSVPLCRLDALNTLFPKESYDIIGTSDLLEHIKDDQSLSNEIYRICKKNGKIIITVPANNNLWSYFDVMSGRERRYAKKELIPKLEKAGFKIEKASSYMFFLFPILWLVRRLNIFRDCKRGYCPWELLELKTLPLLNNFFLALLRLEKKLLINLNFPFGASIICVGRK